MGSDGDHPGTLGIGLPTSTCTPHFIVSVTGSDPTAGRAAYSATEAAWMGLTCSGAATLGGSGVTANCPAPGRSLTDLPAAVFTEEQKAAIAARTVLGRWAAPQNRSSPPRSWPARPVLTSPARPRSSTAGFSQGRDGVVTRTARRPSRSTARHGSSADHNDARN